MRDITFKKPKLKISKPNFNLFTIYLYFVAFFIIFSSGAILDQKYFNFSQLVLIGLIIPFIFFCRNMSTKYIILFSIVFPIYILVNLINYSDTIINYLLFLIKFIFVFVFVRFCVIKEINLFKIIHNVIVVICIYSLITHITLDILKLLPYTTEVINSKPYKVFMGFHFHWQEVNWFSWRVARNNSIFWEPGVFQIYISFALFYQLFMEQRPKKIIIFLLLVSMFTTYSTTGFILTLSLLALRFIRKKSKTLIGFIIKVYIIPIIAVLVIFAGIEIFNQKVNNGTNSYELRSNDLSIGLQLFMQKPFFGWGYLNNSGYEDVTGVPNNSNGLISMLFHQGILGILLHIVPIIALMNKIKKTNGFITATAFVMFYMVSAATEPLMYANFFNMLISLGILGIFEGKRLLIWHETNFNTKNLNLTKSQ
jgi:O-Antigen ligase